MRKTRVKGLVFDLDQFNRRSNRRATTLCARVHHVPVARRHLPQRIGRPPQHHIHHVACTFIQSKSARGSLQQPVKLGKGGQVSKLQTSLKRKAAEFISTSPGVSD